jgi:hypothetical protein
LNFIDRAQNTFTFGELLPISTLVKWFWLPETFANAIFIYKAVMRVSDWSRLLREYCSKLSPNCTHRHDLWN